MFLIGAWAVLFKTLYVASASNSRLTADFLSLAQVRDSSTAPSRDGSGSGGSACSIPLLALVLYLTFRDPRAMVIIGGFFQAATLPIISGGDASTCATAAPTRRLAPSRLSDVCLWFALISITVVARTPWDWGLPQLWPALRDALGGMFANTDVQSDLSHCISN